MTAYYNEFDEGKAEHLRVLIRRGLIAQGEVDERSIVDVRGDDLRGFSQCHFFAGIAGWSKGPAAQRLADGISGGVVRGCRGGFPLAEKAEARTLALRGFGDAIVPQLAAMWIKTVEAEL